MDSPFEVKEEARSSESGGQSSVRLWIPSGEGNRAGASRFEAFLHSVSLQENAGVVVDLSKIGGADSAFLAALILGKREVETKGGRLVLCGFSEPLQALFEMYHLEQVFTVAASVEEALRVLSH